MTIDETKENAKRLGGKIEDLIKTHAYLGATPGQVDFLAVAAALSTITRQMLEQVPPQLRAPMCDTMVATIEVAKTAGDKKVLRQ